MIMVYRHRFDMWAEDGACMDVYYENEPEVQNKIIAREATQNVRVMESTYEVKGPWP